MPHVEELLERQVSRRKSLGQAAQVASSAAGRQPSVPTELTLMASGLCVAIVTNDQEFSHAVLILREKLNKFDCSSAVILISTNSKILPSREVRRDLAGDGISFHFSNELEKGALTAVARSILAEHRSLLCEANRT
ncbi:MAG: hypothetical protein ACK4S6_18940 [Roseateles asaccharophilus]|uniref:hypothetical protein n=1 Tax=Roseateles asaccharophilus TaxID=582607 RepID=UPI00391C3D4A